MEEFRSYWWFGFVTILCAGAFCAAPWEQGFRLCVWLNDQGLLEPFMRIGRQIVDCQICLWVSWGSFCADRWVWAFRLCVLLKDQELLDPFM